MVVIVILLIGCIIVVFFDRGLSLSLSPLCLGPIAVTIALTITFISKSFHF